MYNANQIAAQVTDGVSKKEGKKERNRTNPVLVEWQKHHNP